MQNVTAKELSGKNLEAIKDTDRELYMKLKEMMPPVTQYNTADFSGTNNGGARLGQNEGTLNFTINGARPLGPTRKR